VVGKTKAEIQKHHWPILTLFHPKEYIGLVFVRRRRRQHRQHNELLAKNYVKKNSSKSILEYRSIRENKSEIRKYPSPILTMFHPKEKISLVFVRLRLLQHQQDNESLAKT
jgi:hypothetical protein